MSHLSVAYHLKVKMKSKLKTSGGMSITKANALINAGYRLSLNEMRVIMYGLSLINPLDEEFPISYEINVSRFAAHFNIDARERGFYKEMKEAVVSRFWERDISFWNEELQRVVKERWLTGVEYSDNKNEIKIYFNPRLRKHLHQLKKNFTSYFLANVSDMKSIYGVRIYELCIMQLNIQSKEKTKNTITFETAIIDLKQRLMLENKYKIFRDFNSRVLKKAKEEINKHSDIEIDYAVVKKGRSPDKIKFFAFKKNKTATQKKKKLSSKQEKKETLRNKISELKSFIEGVVCNSDEKLKSQTEIELLQLEKELTAIK